VMLSRGTPMALPVPEEPQPDASRPGTPAARPAAGPIVSLTAGPSAQEGLLGAGVQRPAAADPNANRVLVKGEPLLSISGRADDFTWPRADAPLPMPEPAALPAPAPPAKPGAAGSAPAPKPAAPAPAKKQTSATSASVEASRRPSSLTDDQPRSEPARRRSSPDNVPRPPAAVPFGPIH
jgi:hypothetical protein